MAVDVSLLEERYITSCKKQQMPPNPSILLSFSKMKNCQKHQEELSFKIILDRFVYSDFPALIDAFDGNNLSEIDAIDIHQQSQGIHTDEQHVQSLLRAFDHKLREVNFVDCSFWKYAMSEIFQRGLTCQILSLKAFPNKKLEIAGEFSQLHMLNLDFSFALSTLHVRYFNSLPKLARLSLCGTKINNLWVTISSLKKMPSLVELRFQNCLGCSGTSSCSSFNKKSNQYCLPSSISSKYSSAHDNFIIRSYLDDEYSATKKDDWPEDFYNSCNISEMMISSTRNSLSINYSSSSSTSSSFSEDFSSSSSSSMRNIIDCTMKNSIEGQQSNISISINDDMNSNIASFDFDLESYNSYHPSPICFEKYYREYIISSLRLLQVLDNLKIHDLEREKGRVICKEYFEFTPYDRSGTISATDILKNREMGGNAFSLKSNRRMHSRGSCHSFSRSLSSAKLISSPMPLMLQNSSFCGPNEELIEFFPRQLEYHPTIPGLMIFGTKKGEIVVINHESQKLVGFIPSANKQHSILSLCWLKNYPSKFIAGSDNGDLKIYDTLKMSSTIADGNSCKDSCVGSFSKFEKLTSISINSTDEYFLASGFSKNVALYDVGTGKCIEVLKDLHQEHINVVKFAHHSPNVFSTVSFDKKMKVWDLRQGTSRPCYTQVSTRGNIMVCFSPDDHYLLVSAIDNEVKQVLAVDGRLVKAFSIPSIGSEQNYTRSYYMNGRDYIISGSCEENVVHICCSQTGRVLKDVSLEGEGRRKYMFVQSLRADPFSVRTLI